MSEVPALPFGNRQAYFETEINLLYIRRERKGVKCTYTQYFEIMVSTQLCARNFFILKIDHACYQKRVIVC